MQKKQKNINSASADAAHKPKRHKKRHRTKQGHTKPEFMVQAERTARHGKHKRARAAQDNRPPKKSGMKLEGYFMPSRNGYGFVRTRQAGWPDVFIPERHVGNARAYDLVKIRLLTDIEGQTVTKETRMDGMVLDVLHHVDEADLLKNDGSDMEMIMRQHAAPEEFPQAVLSETAAIPQMVSEQEMSGRRDCRNMPLVTIDGVDSRDFDDAVYCRRNEDGNYFLSVHIADVAHYVRMGSPLEEEAFARATSVYLPDRVLPMLPKELSNGICSLNAGVDRLAMACDMEFTPRGKLLNYEIYPSVIRVYRRLDYDMVNAMLLEKNRRLCAENADLLPLLKPLAALQRILERKRARRGALNFDFPELKIKMGENGEVAAIEKRSQRLAEKMIEQAMLAANETVAEHMKRKNLPFVYRVHEGPVDEKLQNLNAALIAFDYQPLGGADGDVSPKEVQALLKQAEGKPEDEFIQLMVLRSMSHAEYAPECRGHFGLAAKYYCHFTSPIRRYADLAVHRALKHDMLMEDDTLTTKKPGAYMARAAQQSSERERLAEEIERDAVKMKCCLYMRERVGEIFSAKVSGMTYGGVFAALDCGVEGRIAVDDLPSDDYEYFAETMLMKGREHSFTLGDSLTVQVAKVDLLERRIDFICVDGMTERREG